MERTTTRQPHEHWTFTKKVSCTQAIAPIVRFSVFGLNFHIGQKNHLKIHFFISFHFASCFIFAFLRSCCASLCEKLLCCKKKATVESRRTSMNSKKQSIAPTLPPEDNRPKLDESLVDHSSIMKAAIPVLPVGLAWFCMICNCLIPGSGMWMFLRYIYWFHIRFLRLIERFDPHINNMYSFFLFI